MALSNFDNAERGLPFSSETITNIFVSEFENGYEQRRDAWGRTRKKFTIHFNVNSKTEIGDIRDFFIGKSGSLTVFNFTNPLNSTVYSCRFVENSFIIEREYFGVYNARVELIEVFS